MHLVIFDIDGTLTQTTKADEECFVRSLAEVCGFRDIETNWSCYKHVTDSGIFHEIHESRTGRAPLVHEISRFREYFVNLLGQSARESPFSAVAGAHQLLSGLSECPDYRVSLATGAWRDSARLKMLSAGMRYEDYPSASADDAFERESIINLSMHRAEKQYGAFDSVVYVGDGIWDARACRNIGVPFIGIGEDFRAMRLVAEGAACVFSDLDDGEMLMRTLSQIAVRAKPV